MKIGLVYYSRTGNTRSVAKTLEEKLKEKKADVDLIEIEHVKRPGFFTAGRAASRQEELPIKNTDFNMEKYDIILAGCPTWAGKPSPFIKSFFVEAKNVQGKKIAFFGTGMSPVKSREQFIEIMKTDVEKAGMKKVDNFLFLQFRRGKLIDGQQHVDHFVDAILKL